MLNPRDFVPRRAIIFGDLGFDDDLRIELVRDDEIRSLVEAGHAFGSLCFAGTDASTRKNALDRAFEDVAHQLADRITMTGEWTAKEALVQKHGVGDAEIGKRLNAVETAARVGFVEAVD